LSTFDILIKAGNIVDGSGRSPYKADIGIENGKIVAVGEIPRDRCVRLIDVEGLVVSPGFIDMHSHSDLFILVNPRTESKVRQGVTLEVIGNCGSSAAPMNDHLRLEVLERPYVRDSKIDLDWNSMGEYIARLNRDGVALNVVPLVGHGTVRSYVMGFENRPPSKEEMSEMKRIVAKSLREGAFGMSSGLIYPPSCYATTKELVELAKVVASQNGIYTSHIRNESDYLEDAVREAIRIGEESGVSVEISHHKAGSPSTWGKVTKTLKMIGETRSGGTDVTCDVYPYTASSQRLIALLPPWTQEGGTDGFLERVPNPETRNRMREDMLSGLSDWVSGVKDAGWGSIMIASCDSQPEYEGKMIDELAKEKSVDPFEFVFDLLQEDVAVSIVKFAINEEDLKTVLKDPYSMIGSDSSARATYGVLAKGKPHPRSYGTFPRVLSRYVRDTPLLTLEQAVKKMTSLPANKLGLKDRGRIAEGMWADITIFNPQTIEDKATYKDPHQYPRGIPYVIVNGELVIEEYEHTGILPGRVPSK
jgi:N-acyl-D-amino-acid deacylase